MHKGWGGEQHSLQLPTIEANFYSVSFGMAPIAARFKCMLEPPDTVQGDAVRLQGGKVIERERVCKCQPQRAQRQGGKAP